MNFAILVATECNDKAKLVDFRWLDRVFQCQYLSSLSINYVAINKDLEKLLPQLGMGRTWEKFSSLPAKKLQKFETATGKENS